MDPYAPSGESKPAIQCHVCGSEVDDDLDFCMECGHTVGYGERSSDPLAGEDADLATCTACGVGLIQPQSGGHPQCENCGFMPREWLDD